MVEVSLGVAAFTAGALVVAGQVTHPGSSAPAGTAFAPVPSSSPAGELTVASVDTGEKTEKAAKKASGPSKYTDKKAVAYFRGKWKDGPAAKVRDIRTTGRYLRIYTSLPEDAGNSKSAITLCRRGLEYLSEQGEPNPVVFVQAEFGENGNPVLANILGPDDTDCRVSAPKPK
ncbi:hypothetical protein [Planotetraspora sp. GP83]|uniref:hypothetical protein n=1 Tax=Planotetraspora sp. GP83 TaxID=3156264 RepID=UPI003516D5A4